jgi:peptidoglycan/xylan/chitin deacetylase (PgdA/CDA1 family)
MKEEESILKESLAILDRYLGVKPAGYRSPAWEMNLWSPALLRRNGISYDSSLMGSDLPYSIETPSGPLTEVPVQWLLDDAPLYRHVYGASNAIADPDRVLRMWLEEFEGIHSDNGCFVLTCHPHISGRASRVAVLDELLKKMRETGTVWFATCAGVAQWAANSAAGESFVVTDPQAAAGAEGAPG